ncbi:hypothetical transcriptional regulatory protein [Mycobacterium tuberculosis GM 1503]|nr:hypothetical transcriptional regulatory protein [Mycobacterium tuberculosis GM 1503]
MRQHSGIGVLDKAVGVLHAVAESPCGLAELCDRTDLPRATAYRLGAALEVHRLLGRGQDGHWRLGPAITELATHVDDPLLVACAAVLPQLRDATGESVQVYRREGTSRVCVAALEPAAGLRDTVPGRGTVADDRGLGGPKCCWPTPTPPPKRPYCQRRCSAPERWPRCAGAAGRKAWPNASLAWRACRRRCATAGAS